MATVVDKAGGYPTYGKADKHYATRSVYTGRTDDGFTLTGADVAANGVIDDTAAIQTAMNNLAGSGGVVYLPAGWCVVSQTLTIPAGVHLIGQGYGEWDPLNTGRAKGWQGTSLIFKGTGTRNVSIPGVTSVRYGGGWSTHPDTLASLKLTSLYNGDASGATASTARQVSVAVRGAVGAHNWGVHNLRIVNWIGTDGRTDHSNTGTSSLGDAWDIGLLVSQSAWNTIENVQVVGYWRDYGALVVNTSVADTGGLLTAERNIFHRCQLQGRVGLGVRGADSWKVSATTTNSFTVPWSEEHYFASSGTVRGSDGGTYTYTGLTFGGGALTFTGVTPDPSAIFYIRHSSTGFANTEFQFVHCYGLDHVSGTRAATLGLSDSKAFEVSGNPLRGIKFRNCKFHTSEPVIGQIHEAADLTFVDPQFEGSGFLIASPVETESTATAPRGDTRNVVMVGDVGLDNGNADIRLFKPRSGFIQGLQLTSRDDLSGHAVLKAYRDDRNVILKARGTGLVQIQKSDGTVAFQMSAAGNVSLPGASGLTFSGGTRPIFDVGTGNSWALRSGSGNERLQLFGASGTIAPGVDNLQSFGSSSLRWTQLYGINLRTGDGSTLETSGTGTPEGVVTAAVGSRFWRTDGGSGTRLYFKTTGSGNTGWTAIL